VAKLQVLAILTAVALVIGTCTGWLHEHDRRVKMNVVLEQKEQDAKKKDEQIKAFHQSLELMNKEYTKQRAAYAIRGRILEDSTKKLKTEIDWLAAKIEASLPETQKHLATDIATACNDQTELVKKHLSACDSLLIRSDSISAAKDTLLLFYKDDRDQYKTMYELTKDYSPSGGAWAAVGKVETGLGLLAVITRLLGLWGQ